MQSVASLRRFSAPIVLASPFMGQLQSFLRASLSTRDYVLLFGVGGRAARSARSWSRSCAFASGGRAFAAGRRLAFGRRLHVADRDAMPEVNAVERVHFVEYGLIAFLFYRGAVAPGLAKAATRSCCRSCCGFMVGTFDEWLQWFIPLRVGEAHDVFLNLASIGAG